MISISREIAFKSLLTWALSKRDPHRIIEHYLPSDVKPEDDGFARELFFGSIKYRRQLDFYISHFQKAKKLDRKLQQILRTAFYQFIHAGNIPEYAVVSEAVELARKHCVKKQAGFINAVLRNYLRDPGQVKLPELDANPVEYLGIKHSYPDWLVKRYIDRYGNEHAEELLDWCNKPPELWFHINGPLDNHSDVIEKLGKQGIDIRENRVFKKYYECSQPAQLIKSDIFKDGHIIIADPAQSLSPRALNPSRGETVLDLFAAPGGKSASLAAAVDTEGTVIASDNSLNRLKLAASNIKRWQLDNVLLICSDALKFAGSRNFKYILADVPCSGTGTMRRNPDLRWKLQPDDISRLAANQSELIVGAAALLADGGVMVYSTCSLEPEENTEIIGKFMKQNPDYKLKGVDVLNEFEIEPGLYSVSPVKHHSDGAFVAVIERRSRK